MRISWTERQTNEEVLIRVGEDRSLMMVIRKRQMKFLGHVMRRGELESVVLTGYVEGRRARGRQRETYMSGITRAVGGQLSVAGILQTTDDRSRARNIHEWHHKSSGRTVERGWDPADD